MSVQNDPVFVSDPRIPPIRADWVPLASSIPARVPEVPPAALPDPAPRLEAQPPVPQIPPPPFAQSSIISCTSCSDCIQGLGRLLWQGFRSCVGALLRALVNCCLYCFPRRRRRAAGPRYDQDAQRVVDYIALANRGAEPRALNAAFRGLRQDVRTAVVQRVLREHDREIQDIVKRYRRGEERKVEVSTALLEQDDRGRNELLSENARLQIPAAHEFIEENPAAPAIIATLQALIAPRRERQA